MLAPHLHEEVPLAQLAAAQDEGGVSYRTLQRWLADYRQGGLDALTRPGRRDKGAASVPRRARSLHRGAGPAQASPQRGYHPPAGRKHRQGARLALARLPDRGSHRRRPGPRVSAMSTSRHSAPFPFRSSQKESQLVVG
ncbi:helix-turn-helix domain-containing protein [Nonomuraea basaltis]|uniref:helix-turn-helix domain-containing protein n=1 Tax=Nonomuraea basaltis TaxID=2495887 RepID=UPI003B848D66